MGIVALIMFVLVCCSFLGAKWAISSYVADRTEEDLQTLCQYEMQKAIPDANDTEARAAFLKGCYE